MEYFPYEGRLDKMFFPYYGKSGHVSKDFLLTLTQMLKCSLQRSATATSDLMSFGPQPDYVQPLVAVKLLLTKDDYDVEQTVECKVEGTDIRNDDERDKFLGRVTFRVKVSE